MKDLSNRRAFLLAGASAAAGLPLCAMAAAPLADDLLGGGRYQEHRDGPFKYTLSRVRPGSLASDDSRSVVSVPFFPHGLTLDPLNRQRVFAFEKIGPGAGVIDLATMRWMGAISPVQNRRFYGHGACSSDGELLYTTETDPQGVGAIGVREASSLRYVGDFPSFGANPHDCVLIEGGQVMAITNGGGVGASADTPCICYVHVRSRKLLDRCEMPDARFNTGHLFALPGRESIVVSAPRLGLGVEHLGAISRQKSGQKLSVFKSPQQVTEAIFGEALSVLALPARDLVVVTHPTPGMVTFWSLGTGAHRKTLNLAHARGVVQSHDGNTLWISHGAAAQLAAVQLDRLEVQADRTMNNTLLAGSHLFNHALMP